MRTLIGYHQLGLAGDVVKRQLRPHRLDECHQSLAQGGLGLECLHDRFGKQFDEVIDVA